MKTPKTALLLLFTILSLLSISACSSVPISDETLAKEEEKKHEYIVMYDTLSKNYIFDKVNLWIAKNFNSAKSVIDLADKEAGNIVAKGRTLTDLGLLNGFLGSEFPYGVYFTLTVLIKDGKAKYNFDDLYLYVIDSNGNEVKGNKSLKYRLIQRTLKERFDFYITDINKFINFSNNF